MPKPQRAPTGSGSGIPAVSEKELRRGVREQRVAYKGAMAIVGKPLELYPFLKARRKLYQAQVRGINKMLKLLPEDPDLRYVFMH